MTSDFFATIVDVLNVERPAKQAGWAVDGRSIMPLLRAPVAELDKQTKTVCVKGFCGSVSKFNGSRDII